MAYLSALLAKPGNGRLKERRTSGVAVRMMATLLIPLAALLTTEWIHRGALLDNAFFSLVRKNKPAYLLAWLFLILIYGAVSRLSGFHNLATAVTGLTGHLPAAVTYFKLQLRGEPFLPWDISQFAEASNVMGKANLEIQRPMLFSILLFVALFVATSFIHEPSKQTSAKGWLRRIGLGAAFLLLLLAEVFGIYLRPQATTALKIVPDMWMQNRFYKNYGVISGFLTNLQALDIAKPDGYNEQKIAELMQRTEQMRSDKPVYEDSYAASTHSPVQQPNIIYIMSEAFWDVTELEGIEYAEEITPVLHSLRERAATGRSYSPSFGGGTCDVEFEALTGYSVEHLPAGSKPYQQHVTRDMFALPAYLKEQGYQTLAIHGYYRKFWNRDKAYPYLGIDRFIAAEDFENPERKRAYYWKNGLISDAEMGRQIISQYEQRDPKKPVFIHAVTMQNHSSYNEQNYPPEELVTITKAPSDIPPQTLSQLRDYATGIREADAMLGELIAYFEQQPEPTILVFWGDHYNTIGNGYEIFEKTGYIEPGDKESPRLYATPLVIWSNYSDAAVDIGTVAAYQISPVVMDLYGLKKPLFFDFLTQSRKSLRARTRGVTIQPDGSASQEMTSEQMQWFEEHWLLQYDSMFGEQYLHN